MSGIALTNPIQLGQDGNVDIEFIGANFRQGLVVAQLYGVNGAKLVYRFGPGGVETIPQLVAAVPNFAGLRVSMLQHLQVLDPQLGGNVT